MVTAIFTKDYTLNQAFISKQGLEQSPSPEVEADTSTAQLEEGQNDVQ
jgi:hypothetical protein